ncbi:hypothetical protein HanXRQr2_Chr06g0272301 [Helianthus annuus]|uniref:Uncharacterized protein n=1 Tax=Helianthus annuus TaxID=4232 RepID=A0A251UJI5_HELAN|nr:hypothetical protein HanXRQr2_Chr09g0403951 [Helianthus annuus]KAF5803522.1 hypothetical protein HanXRQr2_Chr06g0272301 [Helianthus annuus]KAJ0432998.1 hypothetical protein HanIR_Chr17g0865411 [Helianthus annuus]KAJ0894513.1 hypothetical protein HanPSC8_Chr09g0389871 [Helianthus annuus]
MWLSSHVFSGANSNLGNCVAIRISIMKARSRNGSLGECRESRMKIKHRTRTEHTLNKASATLFCRYSKRRIKSHYVYHLNCKSF